MRFLPPRICLPSVISFGTVDREGRLIFRNFRKEVRLMKNGFRHIGSKKGMTYVELLVALSILALIVVVFTPVLMFSYTNLYKAGEINVNTYAVKSNIEGSLAVRKNNYKVDTSFKLRELNESIDLMMWRIVGSIEGLETMYGSSKRAAVYIGEDTLYDDKSTQEFQFKFTGFSGLSGTSFIKSSSPTKNQVGYIVEAPLYDGQINASQYSVSYNGANNAATITVTGVDITCSPLKISVYYVDSDGTSKFIIRYIEIKPAHMMFVGAADGNTGYYTSEGVDGNGTLSLEARTMTGGSVASGTQFNKARWISVGIDSGRGGSGYYAMCGNDGVIRRLWHITDSETANIPDYASIGYAKVEDEGKTYYRYSWGTDYTEIYTYGYENKSNIGKNTAVGSRTFVYNINTMKALTISQYNGFKAGHDSGERQKNCIQISNNIASSADFSGVTKRGRYFQTGSWYVSGIAYGNPLITPNAKTGMVYSCRNQWNVNWENNDEHAWSNDGKDVTLTYINKSNPWANCINAKLSPNSDKGESGSNLTGTDDQPVVFFASVGGAQGNSGGGTYNTLVNNPIDRVYLMTNNNPGSSKYFREWFAFTNYYYWYTYTYNSANNTFSRTRIHTYEKNQSSCASCDIAARFTESPGAAYAYVKNDTAGNRQRLRQFILDYFASDILYADASTASYTGSSSPSSDNQIPYVRLKCYTNAYTNNSTSNLYNLTRDGYEDSSAIKNPSENNALLTSVSITLTDLCYISHPKLYSGAVTSDSHMTYTGYTPASALVYTPVPEGTAHNNTSTSKFRNFIIQGQGVGSYLISQLPDTSSHTQGISALPSGTVTRTDSNTAFTIGYCSNRSLLYSSVAQATFSTTSTTNTALQFPEEFKTYLGYAQDGEATLAVGYVVKGNADVSFLTTGACTDGSHNYGKNPKDFTTDDIFSDSSVFKSVNEDLYTLNDDGLGTYKRGYFFEVANVANYNQNNSKPSAYIYNYSTCALSYTTLNLKSAGAEQTITNVGTIAVHLGGDSAFKTLYTAPSGDFRFTCAELIDVGDDSYVAYIGDNLGNIWRLDFNAGSTSAVPFIPVVSGKTMNAAYTKLTEIKDIVVTTDKIIAVGTTASGGTKIVVYDSGTENVTVNTVSGSNYTLYDVEYYNDYYYAVGVSGTKGVLLYTANPSGTWTSVIKDSKGQDMKPLYSLAVQQ